jgi:2-methylcitrate dehydratase PrpD
MVRQDAGASVTASLAAFAAETEFADVPPKPIEIATRMVTDTVGVALAATDEPIANRAREGLPSPSAAVPTLSGEGTGTVREAALQNGILAHALDYDDVHEGMGGHPSAPVVAALLPLAHRDGGSGAEFLTAFLVGTEAEIRLAEALNPGLYERGWHPTSVTGTVGAAVAAAKFTACSPSEVRRAVGIAASEASGIKANFGTMTKPFHVGNAARAGVEAADLAAAGFTASEDAIERGFGGFCDLFRGETTPAVDHVGESLGDPWAITDPRPFFKAAPACGSVQSAIAAAVSLSDRVDPADIDSVEVVEHPRRLDHTDNPTPKSGLDAKFSVQYCVAVALRDGAVTLDHFAEDVPRAAVQRRADTVSVRRDADRFADCEYGAAVTVTTASGDTLTELVEAPPGSARNPMSADEFSAKYRRCARRALPEGRVESTLEVLGRLESLPDLSELVDALT